MRGAASKNILTNGKGEGVLVWYLPSPTPPPTIPQSFFRTEMVMVLNWTNVIQIRTISSISSTHSPTYEYLYQRAEIIKVSYFYNPFAIPLLKLPHYCVRHQEALCRITAFWKAESLSYKVSRHPKKVDPKPIFQDFSLLCCQEKGLSKRRFQPNAAAVIALGRWADRRLERDKAPPDVLRHGGVASKEVWRRGCKNKMFDRCSCCSSKKRSLLSTFWYQDKCLTGIWTRRIET